MALGSPDKSHNRPPSVGATVRTIVPIEDLVFVLFFRHKEGFLWVLEPPVCSRFQSWSRSLGSPSQNLGLRLTNGGGIREKDMVV